MSAANQLLMCRILNSTIAGNARVWHIRIASLVVAAILFESPGVTHAQSSATSGDGTVVSIEAEAYSARTPVGNHDWEPVTLSGATGDGALQALPNNGGFRHVSDVSSSPRVDYDINFPASGTYFVWIRGRAASKKDDSLHAGLNGTVQQSADRFSGFSDQWGWSDFTMGGARATLQVSAAGRHTVNLWMREDGVVVDKIVLSRDPAFRPDDFGTEGPPATSPPPPDAQPPDPDPPESEPPDGSAGPAGVVSIEVENYVSNVGVGGHSWELMQDNGASGGQFLQALPNSGTTRTDSYVVNSPRIDLDVNLLESGRYFVWVRGRGQSGKDDSLHVGLNGQAQSSGERLSGFTQSWSWSGKTMGGNRAFIDASVAGAQQLTLWMREDGTEIDKIMLTTDSSVGPEDFGPEGPESDLPGGGANPPADSQNTPPVISGTPSASVVEGTTYRFLPTLFDSDDDALTASVSGLPRWATFNSTTGRIRGTPGAGDIGLFDDIVITVSDGQAQASLGPFSILVQAVASSSVTLSWTPPTTNTDGSQLSDLDGYELRWGPAGGNLSQSIRLSNPGLSRYVLDGIAPGDYEFVIFAINANGGYSTPSNAARTTVR